MIALMILVLAGQPLPTASGAPDTARLLGELFQLSDEYFQCLFLYKSLEPELRDTYFSEGGRTAENLDLILSDRQDHLLKRMIKQGKDKN